MLKRCRLLSQPERVRTHQKVLDPFQLVLQPLSVSEGAVVVVRAKLTGKSIVKHVLGENISVCVKYGGEEQDC